MAFSVKDRRPPCVLLTRPLEDALKLQKKLQDVGISSLVSPLLQIKSCPLTASQKALLESPEVTCFALTSRHALGALRQRSTAWSGSLGVVGSGTEQACWEAGYHPHIVAENSAKSLATLLEQHLSPSTDFLVYLSGQEIRLDIAALLSQKGFRAQRLVVYEAHPAKAFTDQALEALQKGRLTDILFFSTRTAEIFVTLVTESNLEEALLAVTAHGVSEGVLQALTPLPWEEKKLLPLNVDSLRAP